MKKGLEQGKEWKQARKKMQDLLKQFKTEQAFGLIEKKDDNSRNAKQIEFRFLRVFL